MTTFPAIPAGYPAIFERFQTLHQQMLEEMRTARQQAACTLDAWQEIFDSSVNIRLQLRELTSNPAAFEKVEQEIFYFKEIKPLFLAHTLLATYIYHLEMFKADKVCPEERNMQLQRELTRLSRFESRYADFLTIVRAGELPLDLIWFTRDGLAPRIEGLISEETRGEGVLAGLYANRLYRNYLLEQIRHFKAKENDAA